MTPPGTATAERAAKEKPAAAKDTAGAKAEPPKKSKKKLFIILTVVVLLIGGYEAKSILMKPHFKAGQKVPLGKILPLDQLTVNLADGHLVQVSISLQLTSVAAAKAVNNDIPRFEDAAITVLGTYTDAKLLSPTGRAQMKAAVLEDCQKITGTVDGAAQQISAIYFTGFVIQ